jgi:hypothetical protein
MRNAPLVLLAIATLFLNGCGTMGGKASVETITPVSIDATKYQTLELEVRSDVSNSSECVDLVKAAFKNRIAFKSNQPGNNGKKLLLDVNLVEVVRPGGFSRFMIGAMAGSEQIVAKISLSESGSPGVVGRFKVRAEQNNGMREGISTAAAKIASETLDKLNLLEE